MARWTAQGKYPGMFQDTSDPKHRRVVVNLGRAAKSEPRRRAVKVLHGSLADACTACTALPDQSDKQEIRQQASKAPNMIDRGSRFGLRRLGGATSSNRPSRAMRRTIVSVSRPTSARPRPPVQSRLRGVTR